MCTWVHNSSIIILFVILTLLASSPWANMKFQYYGKSMGQKFLMLSQTITVDLGTKTKYQIDSMDKEIKEKKIHLLLDIC